jgi:flagellar protein FliS
MFSSSPGQYPTQRNSFANAYRTVGASTAVTGASPHKLVSMLYVGLLGEIARARGALARRDVAEKGRAIGHAVRIVQEGLLAPLDMGNGGDIAANLQHLYDYVVRRLTFANLHNDDAVLGECARLVDTLREGWDGIADQASTHAASAQ